MNIAIIRSIEAQAKSLADHAIAAIKAVQANPTVQAIEAKWPQAAHLAEKVLGVIPIVSEVEIGADFLVTYGPMLYQFAQLAGIRPMDHAGFDALEESRGRQE